MAFDKKTRNELGKMVAECRRLLTEDVRGQLQSPYLIQPDGTAFSVEKLDLDDRRREIAFALRQWLEHLVATETGTDEERRTNAVNRMVNETAFTYLNRLAALRMCEERGLVIECVRKGLTSAGFQLYERLAEQALGDRGTTYQVFLECVFDELGIDLGVLFDRRAVHSLVFPRSDCVARVLEQLTTAELAHLWKEDETIGWVYQDFNDERERRQMREDSPAPRNTRELAVRNQFFTPRYVVEFLTDNTLARIWYEMRKGDTRLKDDCHFLVRRRNETFLAPGETEPDNKTENSSLSRPLNIRHRHRKDPRDLRVLDPACGSGHFLLYAFDLLETIYTEAWHDADSPASSVTANTLRNDYPTEEELIRAIPALVLRHNLYGIDVDPRACQIASLALWLRAQRTYQRLSIPATDRPKIEKSNIVSAEPMPGEKDLREEFLATLQPPLLAHLVEQVFEKMQLAGEAGSLLKIDEEISESVAESRKEWANQAARAKDRKGNELLFSISEMDATVNVSQRTLEFADITDEQFWDEAEWRIVDALRRYAEQTGNGASVRRGLLREDAAQGFAFIDVCRKRYDVILMNPPFGESPVNCESMFTEAFPLTSNDLYGMFFERTLQWLTSGGKVGAITNRTWLGLPTYENLRRSVFSKLGAIEVAADLGSFVLEAQVETLAAVAGQDATDETDAVWVRLLKTRRKEETLSEAVSLMRQGALHKSAFVSSSRRFSGMPKAVYGYWMSDDLIALYSPKRAVQPGVAVVKQGTSAVPDVRFLRLYWEVSSSQVGLTRLWAPFAKGGQYSPFFDDIHLLIKWNTDGRELSLSGRSAPRNSQYFGQPGVTWPRRTTSPFGPRVFPRECAFADKGPVALPKPGFSPQVLLGLLTTRPSRLLLSVRLGAGDNAPGSASKSYEVGLIGALPYPELDDGIARQIDTQTRRGIDAVRVEQFEVDETTVGFVVPPAIKYRAATLRAATEKWVRQREQRLIQWAEVEETLDKLVAEAFGFTESDYEIMGEELEFPLNRLECSDKIDSEVFRDAYLTKKALPGDRLPGGEDASADVRVESRRKKQQTLRTESTICRLFEITPAQFTKIRQERDLLRKEDLREVAAGTLSYLVGAAFGRWDIRKATDPSLRPDLPDPFDKLPACSSGMLTGDDGLPLTTSPDDYPFTIAEAGITVDDPGPKGNRPHKDDIVALVDQGIAKIWPNHREAIEQELCETLEVQELRDFFRTPSKFFGFHQSRYKKSRRQAPIYWPLSTASGSYTVWVYYHRLNDQTLYTIVNDYLEQGKIDEVQGTVTRTQEDLARASGAEQTKLGDKLSNLEAFLGELQNMKDELLRIAGLPYKPDLNDGVIINAAPLHSLFRFRDWANDCEECWQKLQAGQYDWSHMAMNLRPNEVREKCKTDRSMAIAHGLEDICEVEGGTKRRTRKKKGPSA